MCGTVLEDSAGETDRIADALQGGDRAGAKSRAVHDDGVAFDAAVEIEMRAEAGVENGLVFKDNDGGFDGVERGAAASKNGPAGFESAAAAGIACFDGFVGNIPCAAMDDKRRFHREENGKASKRLSRTGKRGRVHPLDEEIEKEENRAQKKQNEGGIDVPARKTAQRADETGKERP